MAAGPSAHRRVWPATDAQAVTKSDVTTYEKMRGVYVGGAGDLAVTMASGSVTLVGVLAGSVLPISPTQILSTGTTATDIVAFF